MLVNLERHQNVKVSRVACRIVRSSLPLVICNNSKFFVNLQSILQKKDLTLKRQRICNASVLLISLINFLLNFCLIIQKLQLKKVFEKFMLSSFRKVIFIFLNFNYRRM